VRCPLCGREEAEEAGTSARSRNGVRTFLHCGGCDLVFVPPSDHLSCADERARYLLHRNSADDDGYVAFLRRLLDPVRGFLSPSAIGLDFGCGPAPVLAGLAADSGHVCDAYDPLFAPDGLSDGSPGESPEGGAETVRTGKSDLRPAYDFVLCCEVLEHFRTPGEEIARLCARVRPGGILGVMTERWTSLEGFGRWPYASDPTHIAFYHERTLEWIGRRHGLEQIYADAERVTIFRQTSRNSARTMAVAPQISVSSPPESRIT
jgi:SAM-dependent methyltransferase